MHRIYLLLLLVAPLLTGSPAFAASRVERGNLTYENIPQAPADLAEKLDGYLNARQATPLGWSPKGQLLVATRFADVDQLHLVEAPGGARRQLTFQHEPITEAAFSPDSARTAYVFPRDSAGTERPHPSYPHLAERPPTLLTYPTTLNAP